ncbi:hypothetical protein EJ05DRAFT_479037 [Pseudovirgaria hyperparasitica]|uniref:Uncharacterized protein n=1 Tax=Pseudovirgaria hyperparasitica TaxID=470096 RepID=A0A6A6VYF9_9PEZI|nr:uncharacterized protein EJ05DRAFT_479037 [Pseudovirgaria hyperparasitica]KAF2755245.1 hypothetical protein EJ05DRAFT_479037 [Pseudovirgaria hyperparasitica]
MHHNDVAQDESYSYDESDEDDRETFLSGRTLASSATDYVYENGRRYHVSLCPGPRLFESTM